MLSQSLGLRARLATVEAHFAEAPGLIGELPQCGAIHDGSGIGGDRLIAQPAINRCGLSIGRRRIEPALVGILSVTRRRLKIVP